MSILNILNCVLFVYIFIVSVLFILCMDRTTKYQVRWGFILVAGGALGQALGQWIPWDQIIDTIFASGIALLSHAHAEGHLMKFIQSTSEETDETRAST